MARNIEIKAHIEDFDELSSKAASLADEGPTLILQDDRYFRYASGRLKLRIFSPTEGELIFYRRADQNSPKESFYVRTPTSSPDGLREVLTLAYGQAGRVIKERTLYLVGRTRVHIDKVAGLGTFMELEVVLRDDEPADAGVQEARFLMEQLGVEQSQLIESSYIDLIARRGE